MFSPLRCFERNSNSVVSAQVFFEVGALAQIFAINFRHRQSMPAKMPRKFQESHVLFTHVVQDADGARLAGGQPDDLSSRTAQLSLERRYLQAGVWKCCSKSWLRMSMRMPQR